MRKGLSRVAYAPVLGLAAGAVAFSVVPTASAAVNLLADPGFEAGNGGPDASGGDVAAPVGNTQYAWQGYSTYFSPYAAYYTAVTAHTGTQAMKTFGSPNCGIFQQVGVTAGDLYTASIYIENLSADPLTGGTNQRETFQVSFFDTDGVPLGNTVSPTVVTGLTPQNVFVQESLTATAPAGAAYADVRALMANTTDGTLGGPAAYYGGSLFVDDASLVDVTPVTPTGVPEPASLGLIGLGGVTLLGRRRRA